MGDTQGIIAGDWRWNAIPQLRMALVLGAFMPVLKLGLFLRPIRAVRRTVFLIAALRNKVLARTFRVLTLAQHPPYTSQKPKFQKAIKSRDAVPRFAIEIEVERFTAVYILGFSQGVW